MFSIEAVKWVALTLIGVLCLHPVAAQLQADFTSDKTGGCAPLAVSFTNTTLGASATAVYEWQFGNGNSASLKNPGAVFSEAKAYTVTLTVKDGGKTASKTRTITVYNKPVIDFTASLNKGCVPLPVQFTSNVTAGDGAIASYFWDFGDGVTEESRQNTLTHTYTVAQMAAVSLTATNSYGCQSTRAKQNVVTVLPALTAAFTTNKTFLCTLNESATLKNTSTGPGVLSYTWDFGDGETAVTKEAAHVYKKPGTYIVKLIARSSEGCTAEQTRPVNVATFSTAFSIPEPVCQDTYIEFTNKSTPAPDRSTWELGDGYIQVTTGLQSMQHSYYTRGSYTVKLTNEFGDCKEVITKTIQVKDKPALKGFIVDITSPCNAPVKVNFKDTSSKAVKWSWIGSWPAEFTSSKQETSYTYTENSQYYVALTITDAAGCTNTASKEVPIYGISVQVKSPNVSPAGDVRACGRQVPITFYTVSNAEIQKYLWDFGDGNTSTAVKPIHTYTTPGTYKVQVKYTTADGCAGTAELDYYVTVRDKVKADFKASSTTVCGNTPVTFTNLSGKTDYYYWNFGGEDIAASTGEQQAIVRQFYNEGLYTIRLIVTDWVCADTMIKKDYIKIAPPFPKISGFTNTCDGTRGTVTFSQESRQTDSWKWDFGDGATMTLSANQPQVQHTYTKTGSYKVVLTNTREQCTVKDSVYVPVLLKQYPVLSADKTVVCANEEDVRFTVSNLQQNPAPVYGYGHGYGFHDKQYRDGSSYQARTGYDFSNVNLEGLPIHISVQNFAPAQEGFRFIIYSHTFNCKDTTNYVSLKFKGPVPGFKLKETEPCTSSKDVTFIDLSKPQDGVALKTWEWYFGDGPWETYTKGGTFQHHYAWGSTYHVSMKVTDAAGCPSFSSNYITVADGNTLNAAFVPSATTVAPGTKVTFTNTSATTDEENTGYKWVLGDGNTIASLHAEQTFTQPGTYTVTLIATNKATGCSETAKTKIVVKYINAAFAMDAAHISNSKCLPVVVRFTNTSANTSSNSWDFGDGTTAVNQWQPSHVYTKGGKYKITLVTVSDNGTKYTTIDSVEINDPAASLAADRLHSCTAQTITLTASLKNTGAYMWDFGDGTLLPATDTFSKHHYGMAGVYLPALVVKDADGCTASAPLKDPIIIDSLFLSLENIPKKICTPKELLLNPIVVNIAADRTQQSLRYHWDFGTGAAADTAGIRNPAFTYREPGSYSIGLKVASPYGCLKEVRTTVAAFQGLGGGISGPSEICQDVPLQLEGTTQLPGTPQWKWMFEDGSTAAQKIPAPKTYTAPGTYNVTLLVDNNNCIDTIVKTVTVRQKPTITLTDRKRVLCEGAQLTVTAGGGVIYAWSPAAGLNSPSGSSVVVAPRETTTYTVGVTNDFGCMAKDSIAITVVHPFRLQVRDNLSVCKGSGIELKVSGAFFYQWLGNTETLNNMQLANPVAKPVVSTTYTVSGMDQHRCFSDTAAVTVVVREKPAVAAGPDLELLTGTSYQLQPSASADVTKWNWSPPAYLSCSTCPRPQVAPLKPISYIMTVSNLFGCTASDTLAIKLLCSGSRIFIPSSFTPNNDGLNDLFLIKGEGIQQVKSFRIYNRWGNLVFERTGFEPNSTQAAWNGKYKNQLVPVGSYVYIAEMTCNQQSFTQKGTVTVVY